MNVATTTSTNNKLLKIQQIAGMGARSVSVETHHVVFLAVVDTLFLCCRRRRRCCWCWWWWCCCSFALSSCFCYFPFYLQSFSDHIHMRKCCCSFHSSNLVGCYWISSFSSVSHIPPLSKKQHSHSHLNCHFEWIFIPHAPPMQFIWTLDPNARNIIGDVTVEFSFIVSISYGIYLHFNSNSFLTQLIMLSKEYNT